MKNPGFFLSFIAGMMSILSPCILPVIPSFLGYISGISLSTLKKSDSLIQKKELQRKMSINTLLFAVGFSFIFLLLGTAIGFIGETLFLNRPLFQTMAGILIIFFGLQLSGIIKITAFLKERKIELPPQWEKLGYARSFIIGMLFAFSWAPCYGPVLGAILTFAATNATRNDAILLFFFYSLGFLIPLLIMSFLINHLFFWLKKWQKFSHYTQIFSGIFVIVLGILLITNHMDSLVNWINISYNTNGFPFL